jgi:hypothetical protein
MVKGGGHWLFVYGVCCKVYFVISFCHNVPMCHRIFCNQWTLELIWSLLLLCFIVMFSCAIAFVANDDFWNWSKVCCCCCILLQCLHVPSHLLQTVISRSESGEQSEYFNVWQTFFMVNFCVFFFFVRITMFIWLI